MLIMNQVKMLEQSMENKKIPEGIGLKPYVATMTKNFFNKGLPKKEVADTVVAVLRDYDLGLRYEEYRWYEYSRNLCNTLEKKPELAKLKEYSSIPLYKSELDKILMAETDREKKVLAACYFVARYMDCDGWVNLKDGELFTLANIRVSQKMQDEILHSLKEQGLLTFSKKGLSLNSKVTLLPDDEVVMELYEFESIGNKFLGKFKPGFMQCECCGKVIKRRSNRQRYCKGCYKEIKET